MKYQVTVVIEADKPSEASQKAETLGEVRSVREISDTPQPAVKGGQPQHIFPKQ